MEEFQGGLPSRQGSAFTSLERMTGGFGMHLLESCNLPRFTSHGDCGWPDENFLPSTCSFPIRDGRGSKGHLFSLQSHKHSPTSITSISPRSICLRIPLPQTNHPNAFPTFSHASPSLQCSQTTDPERLHASVRYHPVVVLDAPARGHPSPPD